MASRKKSLLKINNSEALTFFLKQENYFTLNLPPYFNFQPVIDNAYKKIRGKELPDVCNKNVKRKPDYPKNYENVNYKLINNKNGKYDWRPFELIHPVLYVDLVQQICKSDNWNLIKNRFKDFTKNKNICCCSIPLYCSTTKNIVLNWWDNFEQKSIANSLKYKYMACTDISNCYSSIYTHSIAWAIHTKDVAKQDRTGKIIGNIIDERLQNMNYGQTNGIPQGSVLMDFIAEIVLGYSDEIIGEKLKNEKIINYQILRYRDDYRIFANDLSEINKILKIVTEELANLNFKLNSNKTFITDDIINGSVKKDKLYRLQNPIDQKLNIQKKLLFIYNFGLLFPNSGSLRVLLTELYTNEFLNMKKRPNNYEQNINIIVNIMIKNPSTYGICIGLLSGIFKFFKIATIEKYINLILNKFEDIPNSDYLEITLQRLTLPYKRDREYNSQICKKVYSNTEIWNSKWLNFTLDESSIINEKVISSLSVNVLESEVNKFSNSYYDN